MQVEQHRICLLLAANQHPLLFSAKHNIAQQINTAGSELIFVALTETLFCSYILYSKPLETSTKQCYKREQKEFQHRSNWMLFHDLKAQGRLVVNRLVVASRLSTTAFCKQMGKQTCTVHSIAISPLLKARSSARDGEPKRILLLTFRTAANR